MKRRLLLIAISVVAFCACNDTDVNSGGKSKQEDVVNSISFRTYVPKTLKGGTTTISTLETGDGFSVYAYHSGTSPTSYFEDVIFKFDEQGPYWISSPIYYWPSGSLDFYCFYPTTIKPDATPPLSFDVNIDSYSANQEDIVMAYAADQDQPSSDASVSLTFQHATSRITFLIQTAQSSGLNLTVDTISIKNIYMDGTITYDTSASEVPYFTVTTSGSATDSADIVADAIEIVASDDDKAANTTPFDTLYILPQSITKWTYDNSKDYKMTTGTYINIYGTLSGVAEYTGNIAIPLDSTTDTWEAGVSYEYVILFGKGGTTGGGGYNPDQAASGTDNEKPEKILLPITLFVTVAEWSNVSQEDIIL